jgi:hypothetical protein
VEYGQANVGNVKEAPRTLGVPEGFARIDKALQRLGGQLESLKCRLGYVSRPSSPEPVSPAGRPRDGVPCGIGEGASSIVPALQAIDDFAVRLNVLTDLVNDMTARLEI